MKPHCVPLTIVLAFSQTSSGFAITPGAHSNYVARTHGLTTSTSHGGTPQPQLVRARQPAPLMAAAASKPSGGATVSSSIINLSKNIVGSGVLALAAGIAAFTSSPFGVVPATLILLALGGLSGYTFSLIARVGDEVGADTYRDTWAKVFGEKTALLPALTVAFKTYVGGLSYSIILGDSFASIAALAGLPPALQSSNAWIIALSAFVLLPLSLMRDLSSLAIGSVIGTAGTLYTALFIWFRKFAGSYAPGGAFHELISEGSRPAFAAATGGLVNTRIFVLVSMLATAFLAHYNAPKYYKELESPSDGSSKLASFNLVCAGAFGLASLLCASIMAGGFLTFGGAAKGLILNSYATTDPLALLARLGICASIIFSYPLNFVGLRDGVLNMVGLSDQSGKTSVHVTSTLILLCVMNGLALKLKNLGLVVAVGGAALGTSLVYTFPALMFIQATRQLEKKEGSLPAGRKKEMYLNMVLVLIGLSLGGLGVSMSLKSMGGH